MCVGGKETKENEREMGSRVVVVVVAGGLASSVVAVLRCDGARGPGGSSRVLDWLG